MRGNALSFRLKALFVLCPQLGQNLLVAGLSAGDAVKVAAGGFADRHALSSKGSADVAEIAFVLGGGGTVKFYPHDFPPRWL